MVPSQTKRFDLIMAKNTSDWKAALALATGFEPSTNAAAETEETQQQPARKKRAGVVYSSDPHYAYTADEDDGPTTLPQRQQKLRVSKERAGRGGKTVTLIRGFIGSAEDLQALGRALRQRCGVGGSVKLYNDEADAGQSIGEIIVQGDLCQRVVELLKADGYSQTK